MVALTTSLLLLYFLINMGMGQEVAVMRAMSGSIGDVVLECQAEMHFDNNIVTNFVNFWNEKDELLDTDMGCALLCVFSKLELMDHSGHVQKLETEVFLRAQGADDRVTGKIVELFLMCERVISVKPVCEHALLMTKCFRYGVFRLHWAPKNFKPDMMEEGQRRTGTKNMRNSVNKRRRGRKDKRRHYKR